MPANRAHMTTELHEKDSAIQCITTVTSKLASFESGACGLLPEQVCQTRSADLGNLKHRLNMEWAKLDHTDIRHSCSHVSVTVSSLMHQGQQWTF